MSFNHKKKLKIPEIPFDETCAAGTIVKSRCGRSRGALYVVIATTRNKYGRLYAYLANGTSRTTDSPKLKNSTHLDVIKKAQNTKEFKMGNSEIEQLLKEYSNWRD